MKIRRYPPLMRWMHWLTGVLLLAIIAGGWFMTGLDSSVPYKYDIYDLHKSLGVLIILLMVLRVGIRKFSTVPKYPDSLSKFSRIVATATHHTLYLLAFLVPISGYLMSNAGGRDVPFFGLTAPRVISENSDVASALHSFHVLVPYILLALVGLHIVAALYHRYFDKPENDILKRMW